MASSDEDDSSFPSHDKVIPQSSISALFQSKTEKGIRKLCCELLDLKDGVENLHDNMSIRLLAFYRISEEVVELEHELCELQKHISAQGNLVRDLMSSVCYESEECNIESCEFHDEQTDPEIYELQEASLSGTGDDMTTIFERLDVLLVEHKVEEALESLDAVIERLPELNNLGDALMKRKAMLEGQLVEVIDQPSTYLPEMKNALSSLIKLGNISLAHQLLLKSYGSHLRNRIQAFLPSCRMCPTTFPATLSKLVFSIIAAASKESTLMFGDDSLYANRTIRWAEWQIESFVQLVKDNAPSSETVSALSAANICIEASLRHCTMLESQGLELSKLFMVLLHPYTEEVIDLNFKRAQRTVLDLAGNDEIMSGGSPRFASSVFAFATSLDSVLIDSGIRFLSVIKDIVEQLTPLAIFHFGGSFLVKISQLFDIYVEALIRALPSPSDDDNLMEPREALTYRVETDSQHIALLGLASAISDNLSPEFLCGFWTMQNGSEELRNVAAEDFVPIASTIMEYREWKRRLVHSCDKLRDHFCRQYVLNFIYSRDGKACLDARIYLNEVQEIIWNSAPLPSLPFQALFAKLHHLAAVAGDVLAGKEKVQKSLLARLTETVVMWLSDEQDFWGVFEDDSVQLHPLGLLQLILDMNFVVEIARFLGYPSRHLHQIVSSIIARAIRTFAARGIEPQSLLPEDEWLVEAAKSAINKLIVGTSGSDVSETDEVHHLGREIITSDSECSPSPLSNAESSESFASAMDELESPVHPDPME